MGKEEKIWKRVGRRIQVCLSSCLEREASEGAACTVLHPYSSPSNLKIFVYCILVHIKLKKHGKKSNTQ